MLVTPADLEVRIEQVLEPGEVRFAGTRYCSRAGIAVRVTREGRDQKIAGVGDDRHPGERTVRHAHFLLL
jgi:hypothetical protein